MGLRWVLASAAALVAAAACCPPAGAIVGGGPVSIQRYPYQVALVNSAKTAVAGQFCGGSIRDALHIITAAHCVVDTPQSGAGQPVSPASVDVLAGVANLEDEALGQRIDVSTISYDQSFDSDSLANDAALLTLSQPLTVNSTKQPITLIDDVDWAGIGAGTPLFVMGWGQLANHTYPDELQGVSVNFITDTECTTTYFWPDTGKEVQVCAGSPGHDSCNGDSGGPLIRTLGGPSPGNDRLVGIVSGGDQVCANPNFPGLYTEVAAPSIRSFLQTGQPIAAPTNQSGPSLSGTQSVGGLLACARGVWIGSPSFRYQFIRSTTAGADIAVVADSGSPTYVVAAGDAGNALRCKVTASNSGGASSAETGRLTIAGTPSVQPSQNLDKNAPVARITKSRCTSSSCTLTVSVSDAGFSAGIKTVQATVKSTYRTTCRRNGRRVKCTKTKAGRTKVKKLAATRFRVSASKLPVGKQAFRLLAIDKAGHRQRLATKKTLTTKKKKSKKRS